MAVPQRMPRITTPTEAAQRLKDKLEKNKRLKEQAQKRAGKGKKKPKKPKGGKGPKPQSFIDREISQEISHDRGLTSAYRGYADQIQDQLTEDSARLSGIAGQYDDVLTQQQGGLNAYTQGQIDRYSTLGNNVGRAQSAALGKYIANRGTSGARLLSNMKQAAEKQHLDYARQVRGYKPYLEQQQQALAQEAALKNAQLQVAAQEYGLDSQKFQFAQQEAAADLQYKYDKLNAEQRQSGGLSPAQKNQNAAALRKRQTALRKEIYPGRDKDTGQNQYEPQPFRTSLERLIQIGHKPDRAAQIAASWARTNDRKEGKPVTFRKGHAVGIYKSMVNRGVSHERARALTKKYTGVDIGFG